MHPVPTLILLVILFFSSLVAAANFTQCLEDFRKNDPSTIGGVDSRGNPTSPAQALGLTYKTCTALCGSAAERFGWRGFAQIFSSWLLPWLALTSQLPFGSGNYIDDFFSVAMSVGSPALAAYSLALTSINARLVYHRAKRIKHDSKTAVARALITLQQTPLELTKDKRLLAFITINDQWRQEIVERLNRRTAWPIVIGPPVLWVVFAFTLTLTDSFLSLDNPTASGYDGHAVGTLWLWLLCLVIGWWWVPTFTCSELKSAIGHANETAAKKTAKMIRQKATKAHNSGKIKISRLPKLMPILKGFKKPVVDPPQVPEENESGQVRGEPIHEEDTEPVGREIEPKASPLPGHTRHRSAVSSQLTTASQQGLGHFSVNANPTANQSAVSFSRSAAVYSIAAQSEILPERDRLLIPKDGFGPLNRDERRLAAMFNYSRIMRYLVLVDDVMRVLDGLAREKDEKRRHIFEAAAPQPTEAVVFPPGALISMFIASFFALILQCGTSVSPAVIAYFTPAFGVGCRSLGYIIYGAIAVLILLLTIISTISARISETRHEQSTIKKFTAFIAIALRRISLSLALINATGLVVLSCLQFSHFLDNCYCNASVIGRGTDSYVVASYEGWISTMRSVRIVATVFALVSMAIYMIFLWFVSALPAEIDRS